MMPLKTILTIAGSDPSGGAGIQADLKTFTVLNTYGAAVPTNLTVQNTLGVQKSHPVAANLVGDQINCVLDDLEVSHIKIGMVGTKQIASAIVSSLARFTGEIILDPVMKASDGSKLTESLGPVANLAQKATVITPNFTELCLFSNSNPTSPTASLEACQNILTSYPNLLCLVLKGGHFPGNNDSITDYMVTRNDKGDFVHFTQTHPRVDSTNTHGTGCTYASAFAAYHQKTGDYCHAFQKSSHFVYQLLKSSSRFRTGKGRGGLIHHLFRG